MNTLIIRPILKKDNPHIAKVIRKVLVDFGVPKVGTAYADKTLDTLYEVYQKPRAFYFVVELNGKILGGAGVAQLDNYEGNVCELQKMYFLEEARGLGLGTKMINLCLEKAKGFMFDKCYLETMTYMKAAQKLYQKNEFKYIDGPMGNTGHYSCPVHMLKDL
ncbi:MAG: GNAT family N-acetyltransferase [Flavobacteriaceae bacterium]